MQKRIISCIKFLPACITAFTLLFSLGFSHIDNTHAATSLTSRFSDISVKYNPDAVSLHEKDNNPYLPDELLTRIEEQEENTNDDNNDETTLLTDFIQNKYKYTPYVSSDIYYNNNSNNPEQLAVPLYILFHSWKNFIS